MPDAAMSKTARKLVWQTGVVWLGTVGLLVLAVLTDDSKGRGLLIMTLIPAAALCLLLSWLCWRAYRIEVKGDPPPGAPGSSVG